MYRVRVFAPVPGYIPGSSKGVCGLKQFHVAVLSYDHKVAPKHKGLALGPPGDLRQKSRSGAVKGAAGADRTHPHSLDIRRQIFKKSWTRLPKM